MFYDMGYMGGLHGGWWLLLLIVVIGAVLYLVWARPAPRDDRAHETPHDALKRRLAAGEITPTDYEGRKALLDRDIGPGKA